MPVMITIVNNPFDKTDKDIKYALAGDSIERVLDQYDLPENYVLSLNGEHIDDRSRQLRDNESLVVVPVIEGGGGSGKSSFLMTAAQIGLMAGAMAAFGPGGLAFTGIGYSLAVAGTMAVGGYLLNEAFGSTPSFDYDLGTTLGSSTGVSYSWSPQTTQQQGLPIPVVYGEHKVHGNVIATHMYSTTDSQYLNVLIALCEGRIEDVTDIVINDKPLDAYDQNLVSIRRGQINQSIIAGFHVTKIETRLNTQLKYQEPVELYTSDDTFNNIEIDITFPDGLFYYIPVAFNHPTTGEKVNAGYYEHQVRFDIVVTDVSTGSIVYAESDHRITENVTSPFTITIPIMTRELPDEGVVATPRVITVPDYSAEYSNLKIWLYRNTENAEDRDDELVARYSDRTFVTAIREVSDFGCSYPSVALVGVYALATSDLNGSISFSCTVKGKIVRVYRDGVWYSEYSKNPAWLALDALTRPFILDDGTFVRYRKYDLDFIHLEQFIELAEYCDELIRYNGTWQKRAEFNAIFETEMNVWSAASAIASVGRGVLLFSGFKITVFIDKPALPTQLFSVGNTMVDSTSVEFLSLQDRARDLEITFNNADKDYEKEQIRYLDVKSNELTNTTRVSLFGVTNYDQAMRYGEFQLAQNRYLLRCMTLRADIDSIAATVGDVVSIQSDIPSWGVCGGRLESVDGASVILDTVPYLEAGESYGIVVVDAKGSPVERKIISSDGQVMTLSAAIPDIGKYSVYSVGVYGQETKPFRVIGVSRPIELKATLTLLEYNESIYNIDNSGDVQPTIQPVVDIDYRVRNAGVGSYLVMDGSVLRTEMLVQFSPPADMPIREYQVKIRLYDSSQWLVSAKTTDTSYRMYVSDGKTYVVSISAIPFVGAPSAAVGLTHYVAGKQAQPNTPEQFTVTVDGNDITLTWRPVIDLDLKNYRLLYNTTENVTNAVWLTDLVELTYHIRNARAGHYFLAAIDTTGNISEYTSVYTELQEAADLNIVAVYTESGWLDAEEPFVYITNMGLVAIGGDFDEVLDIDEILDMEFMFEPPEEAVYEFSEPLVLESSQIVRVKSLMDYYLMNINNDFDMIADLDAVESIDTAADSGSLYLQYAVSSDGESYGEWQNLGYGDIVGRFFKFRLLWRKILPGTTVVISSVTISLDMLDREVLLKSVAVPLNGYAHEFNRAFYSQPITFVSVQGSPVGVYHRITELSGSGFTIKLYDALDSPFSGVVDILIKGY